MHTSLPSFRRRPESSGRGPQNIDLPCMSWLFLPKTVPKSIASALLDPGFRRGDGAVEMCAYGSPLRNIQGAGGEGSLRHHARRPPPSPQPSDGTTKQPTRPPKDAGQVSAYPARGEEVFPHSAIGMSIARIRLGPKRGRVLQWPDRGTGTQLGTMP